MIFAEPGPPWPMPVDPSPPPSGGSLGLLPADCDRCEGATMRAREHFGEALCARCARRSAPLVMPTARPRYAGGRSPGGRCIEPTDGALRRAQRPHSVRAATVRVLSRSAATDPALAPAAPRQALYDVLGARGEGRADLRRAFAEDLAKGAMVESYALRVPGLGYAVWINGRAVTAVIRCDGVIRPCSVAEFVARACGRNWAPPPPRALAERDACPRCGAEVRLKKDGQPYAHRRGEAGVEGGGSEKVPCV